MAEYREPLYNLLPEYVQFFGDESGLLKDFCDALQLRFEDYYRLKDSLRSIYSISGTPPEWLDWIGQLVGLSVSSEKWLGVGLNPNWSNSWKKKVIREVGQYWRKKGTLEGVRKAIELWLQWEESHNRNKLQFLYPFGKEYSDTPNQWHGWFFPYKGQVLQNYKEFKFFGSKTVPTPYQPYIYEIQNSRNSWHWQEPFHNRIFDLVRVSPNQYSKTGNSPNHIWMHFHPNVQNWNNIIPDIHTLNWEIWEAVVEPFVFVWDELLRTEIKLYEDYNRNLKDSVFGRDVSYTLDGYDWLEIYPRLRPPKTKVLNKTVSWQDSFVSTDLFFRWENTYGSYQDRLIPSDTYYKWTSIETPCSWGADWISPYSGEWTTFWQEQETVYETKPIVSSSSTSWNAPYAHYWHEIENKVFTTFEEIQKEYISPSDFNDWGDKWHSTKRIRPEPKTKVKRIEERAAQPGGDWLVPFGDFKETRQIIKQFQVEDVFVWESTGIGWYHPYFWNISSTTKTKITRKVNKEKIGFSLFCHWGTPYGDKGGRLLYKRNSNQNIENHIIGRWGSDWWDYFSGIGSTYIKKEYTKTVKQFSLHSKNIDWLNSYIPGRIPLSQQKKQEQRSISVPHYQPETRSWLEGYIPATSLFKKEQINEVIETFSFQYSSDWNDRFMSLGGIPLPPKQWVEYVSEPHYEERLEQWGYPYAFSGVTTNSYYEQILSYHYIPKAGMPDWLSPYQPPIHPEEIPKILVQTIKRKSILTPNDRQWKDSYLPSTPSPQIVREEQINFERIDNDGFTRWDTSYGHTGGQLLPTKQQIVEYQESFPAILGGDWLDPFVGDFSFLEEVSTTQQEVDIKFLGSSVSWNTPYQPPITPRKYPEYTKTFHVNEVRIAPYTRGWQEVYPYSSSPTIVRETINEIREFIGRHNFWQWGDIYGSRYQLLFVPTNKQTIVSEKIDGYPGGDWWDPFSGQILRVESNPQINSERIWRGVGTSWNTVYPYTSNQVWLSRTYQQTIEQIDNSSFNQWNDIYGSKERPLPLLNDHEYESIQLFSRWGSNWQDPYFGSGHEQNYISQSRTEQIWIPSGAAWGGVYPYSLYESKVQQPYQEVVERIDTAPFGLWNDYYGSRPSLLSSPETELEEQNISGHVGSDWLDPYTGESYEITEGLTQETIVNWIGAEASWFVAYPYNLSETYYQTNEVIEEIDTAPFGHWSDIYGAKSTPIKSPQENVISEIIPAIVGGDWFTSYTGEWQENHISETTIEIDNWENIGVNWNDTYTPSTSLYFDVVWQQHNFVQEGNDFTSWNDVFTESNAFYRTSGSVQQRELQQRIFSSLYIRPFSLYPILDLKDTIEESKDITITSYNRNHGLSYYRPEQTLLVYEIVGPEYRDNIPYIRWHQLYSQKEITRLESSINISKDEWDTKWKMLLSSGYSEYPTLFNNGEKQIEKQNTTITSNVYRGVPWSQRDRTIRQYIFTENRYRDDIPFSRWHLTYFYREYERTQWISSNEISELQWKQEWLPLLSQGYEDRPTVINTGETIEKKEDSYDFSPFLVLGTPWTFLGRTRQISVSPEQLYADSIPFYTWHKIYKRIQQTVTEYYLESEISDEEWKSAWGSILSSGFNTQPTVEDTGETIDVVTSYKDLSTDVIYGSSWHRSSYINTELVLQDNTPEYSDDIPYKKWHSYYRTTSFIKTVYRQIPEVEWQNTWQNKISKSYPRIPHFSYNVVSQVPTERLVSLSNYEWLQLYNSFSLGKYNTLLEASKITTTRTYNQYQVKQGVIPGEIYTRGESSLIKTELLPFEERYTTPLHFSRWHQVYKTWIETQQYYVTRPTHQWLQSEWYKIGGKGYPSYPLLGEVVVRNESINTTFPMPKYQWLNTFNHWSLQSYPDQPITIASVATLKTENVLQTESTLKTSPAHPWKTFDVWHEYIPRTREGKQRYSSSTPGKIWAQRYTYREKIYNTIIPINNWREEWQYIIGQEWNNIPLYSVSNQQVYITTIVPVSKQEWHQRWRFLYGHKHFHFLPITYDVDSRWEKITTEEWEKETFSFSGERWQQKDRIYFEERKGENHAITPYINWTPYHILYSQSEHNISEVYDISEISEEQWLKAWLPFASPGYSKFPTIEGKKEKQEVSTEAEEIQYIDFPSISYPRSYDRIETIDMVPEGDRYTPEISSSRYYGSPKEWIERNVTEDVNYVSQWKKSWENKVSQGYASKPTVFIVWDEVEEIKTKDYEQSFAFHTSPWMSTNKTLLRYVPIPGQPTIFPKQPSYPYYGMPRSLEREEQYQEEYTPFDDCIPGLKINKIIGYEQKILPAVPPSNILLKGKTIKPKYEEKITRQEHQGWLGFQWYQIYTDYPPAPISIDPVPTFSFNFKGLGQEFLYPNSSISSVELSLPMPYVVQTLSIILSFEDSFEDVFSFKNPYPPLDIETSKPVFDTDSMWHVPYTPEIKETIQVQDNGVIFESPKIVLTYNEEPYDSGYRWYYPGIEGHKEKTIDIPIYDEVEYCNVPNRYTTLTTDNWKEHFYVSPINKIPTGKRYNLLKQVQQVKNWELLISTSEGVKRIPPICMYVINNQNPNDNFSRSTTIDFTKGFDTLYMEFSNRMPTHGKIDSILLWLKGYGFIDFRSYSPELNYTDKEVEVFPILVSLKTQFPVIEDKYTEIDTEAARLATSHLPDWGVGSATIDLEASKENGVYTPSF